MNVGGLRDARSIQISDKTVHWVCGSYGIVLDIDLKIAEKH